MALQTDLLFITDLNKGVAVTELRPLLFTGDEESHRFVVEVMRDGQAENLSGTSVVGYFIRADEAMVTLEGSVDSQGRAVVALKKNCYSIHGRYQLVIRVTQGDVKTTIFCADGYMRHTTSDTIIDEENVIPSLDDLLAQIAVMEEATARANAAADKANNAQGPAGATPNLTIGTVSTLPAGSLATATLTGTAENPVLNLGLPKGVDGDGADGTVQSVNGQTGAVQLTAADVGAVASVNGKTGNVMLTAEDVGAVESVNGKTGAFSLTAEDVGAAMATHAHTAAEANAIERGANGIIEANTVANPGNIAVNSYISQYTVEATKIEGYRFVGVLTVSSNSSYTLPYATWHSGENIVYSLRNLSTKEVDPTVTFRCLYVQE